MAVRQIQNQDLIIRQVFPGNQFVGFADSLLRHGFSAFIQFPQLLCRAACLLRILTVRKETECPFCGIKPP